MRPPTDHARIEIADPEMPGMTLRISRDGVKTFAFRYRDKHGDQHRVTLGRYPGLSLKAARAEALKHRGAVAKGESPAEKKRRAKVATLSELVQEFLIRYAYKNRSAKETERILNKELVAKLGKNRDITSIKKPDILKIIDGIADRGKKSAARNALAQIRKLFNWAVSRDLLELSPANGVTPPAPPAQRHRTLTDDELAAIWLATFKEEWRFNHYIRLLMLTGQRRTQTAKLRWSWIDFERDIINFPASVMKNKLDFTLPMSAEIKELLKSLTAIASDNDTHRKIDDRVFPTRSKSNSESVISGFSKAKQRLDKASGVTDWVYHDFRRAASTYLNGPMKVEEKVVERLLSHKPLGIGAVYNKWEYLDEKRTALALWTAHPSLQAKAPLKSNAPARSRERTSPESKPTAPKRRRGRPQTDPKQDAFISAGVQMYHSATRRIKADERAESPDGLKSTPTELADEETAKDLALSVGTMRRLKRRRSGSQK
ncbi:MAG: tyrosine-type recombinase/integrase [Amphiplicatus sp.]|nr:tyrosine-type recombinase/integrase [Amphiplicatus sp.]